MSKENTLKMFINNLDLLVAMYRDNQETAVEYREVIQKYQDKYQDEEWFREPFVNDMFSLVYGYLALDDE